jgi:tetratricopeptide (TPR) repeat protein
MLKILSTEKMAALILVSAVFLVFSNTLFNEFIWDDKMLLEKDIFDDWKNIGSIFSKADTLNPDSESPYYRPLTYVMFLIDHQLWGQKPFGYRIENVLLHALTVLLLYRLILRVFGDSTLALFSSFLFAVHPVTTEPVNFISGGRNTMLCAAFSIGSLLLLTRAGAHGRKWVVFSLVAYSLALLSKEQAAALPLFLAAVTLLSGRKDMKVNVYCLVSFFAVTAIYFLLRLKILGAVTSREGVELSYETAGLVISCLFEYFRIMLLPFGLSAVYVTVPADLFSYKTIIDVITVTVLMYLVFRESTAGPLRISGIWLVLSFLPVSNIIPIPSAAVADRYLYIPLLGACVAAGYLISRVYSKKRALAVSLFLICIVTSAVLAHTRNNVWKSSLSLWEDTVKKSPESHLAHYNLGVAYETRGLIDRAVQQFERTIKLNPGYVRAYNNLGVVYQKQGFTSRAIEQFETAVRLKPDLIKTQYNLGVLYQFGGNTDKALQHYRIVTGLDPGHVRAHYNLGVAYQSKGVLSEAAEHYRIVTELDPGNVKVHKKLGIVYYLTGQFDKAIHQYKTVIKIQPENYEAYYNMGLAYQKKGIGKKAEEYFQKAEKYR